MNLEHVQSVSASECWLESQVEVLCRNSNLVHAKYILCGWLNKLFICWLLVWNAFGTINYTHLFLANGAECFFFNAYNVWAKKWNALPLEATLKCTHLLFVLVTVSV